MKGWVQVAPPDGASTDDEFFFAPSLFRAHNARERLAQLAGVPATEQRDSALLAQLQGASLSHGVSVGASLLQGAPLPTAEFSSLGLSASLRAGAVPCSHTGRAATDRTRAERRTREDLRTACICSELPCICSEEPAETMRHAEEPMEAWRPSAMDAMEPMEPSSLEALSLEAMEAQFIAPPLLMSMGRGDDTLVASARRTGLEECRARLEAAEGSFARGSQWDYELLPTGTYLPASSAMDNEHLEQRSNVQSPPAGLPAAGCFSNRAWVQQVAREAISSREVREVREVREAAATEPWGGEAAEGWGAEGWSSADAVAAAADAEAQWRDGGGTVALSSGWAAAVDIPPWHSPQIRRWCAARARTRTRTRPLALFSPSPSSTPTPTPTPHP